jgi:hypothetical protein
MKAKLQVKRSAAVVLYIATAALVGTGPAGADGQVNPTNSLQTVSDTAGAALLLPYFEVDLTNPTGMDTIFTINNMGSTTFYSGTGDPQGPTAVLAHVVIWSDLGVPVFNFNVYLTGLDVARVDLRSVLTGSLPQSASAGQDPTDTISPKGPLSQDINFASCNTSIGYTPPINAWSQLPPGALTAAQINNLQTSLTGQPSVNVSSLCAGLNHSDNIARGYVTVDTVNNCTSRFPGDSGYLGASGSGDVTNQTQITGEVFYVDQLHAIARSDNLVHIHASYTDPLVTTSGNYTFYGRYDGFTAIDNRQPLATNFGARFVNGNFTGSPMPIPSSPVWGMPPASPPPGLSSVIVWRDSKVAQTYFSCGNIPSWYPLGQEALMAFDEQEHVQSLSGTPFPAATQIVPLGGSVVPVSFAAGWLFLDLNATVTGQVGGQTDTAAAQGWVQVIEQNGSQIFNLIHRAQQMDSATMANHAAFE